MTALMTALSCCGLLAGSMGWRGCGRVLPSAGLGRLTSCARWRGLGRSAARPLRLRKKRLGIPGGRIPPAPGWPGMRGASTCWPRRRVGHWWAARPCCAPIPPRCGRRTRQACAASRLVEDLPLFEGLAAAGAARHGIRLGTVCHRPHRALRSPSQSRNTIFWR